MNKNRIELAASVIEDCAKTVGMEIRNTAVDVWSILRDRPVTVYVVTFWHVDSMGGWNWYPAEAKADAIERRELWEKELRDEAQQKGVVALFRIIVPVAHSKSEYDINEYLETLTAGDKYNEYGTMLGEYRQHMGSMTGY